MSLRQKARDFAAAAHAAVDHKRKYTGEPYIVHPEEVAELVASVGGDEAMIAAAFLHDSVEDTEVTIEDINREFGRDVAELVEMLTDISRPEDGNRAKRKALDLIHTAGASARAKTIKLADLISNARDIGKHDPHFSKVYFAEKERLLEVLKEGHAGLYKMAMELVKDYRRRRRR